MRKMRITEKNNSFVTYDTFLSPYEIQFYLLYFLAPNNQKVPLPPELPDYNDSHNYDLTGK